MVTTVTNNSPQSINTSLFSLDKEVQEVKKAANAINEKLADINTKAGVISVNGKQGIVELDASDVKALPDTTVIPTTTGELTNNSGFVTINDVGSSFIPVTRKVNNKQLNTDITLTASDVGALPDTTVIPTKTSQLTNDSGFVTFSVACPVGTILSGLYTTAPGGFLLCNGQEVAIADYPELYAVIGSLEVCQSSNAGMFKLPNLQDRFLQGANGNLGKNIKPELPNIKASTTDEGFVSLSSRTGANGAFRRWVTRNAYWTGTGDCMNGLSFDASLGQTKADGSFVPQAESVYKNGGKVQPPALTVNYVIKY